jgi:hypothetical protein
MKLSIKYTNGSVDIKEVSRLSLKKKNPCTNCRKDGGCYDHGCFLPEDWGDFLVSENEELRLQDIDTISVVDI